MHFTSIIVKNLRRRKMRTALTCAGIGLSVAAVVVLTGAAQTFEDSFNDLYEQRGADLVVQRAGGHTQLSSGVSEKLGDRIKQLPMVKDAVGSLMDLVSFPDNNMFAVIVNGWPPDSPVLQRVEVQLGNGRRLQAGDRRSVMLGSQLAANLRKKAGDHLEMYSQTYEVVGVFDSFNRLETGAVWMLLDELQQTIDRRGQVTGYVVKLSRVGDPDSMQAATRQIEALDPHIKVTPAREFVHNIRQINITRGGGWVLSVIAVVIGAIGVLNAMLMAVFERTREIGALRALGWRKSRVVWLLVGESLAQTVVGGLLGIVAGALLLKLLAHLPTTSNLLDGRLPPRVVWQAMVVALVAGILGAIYPAIYAVRLRPVEALRR